MTRLRAADDFAAIRARMEELRRTEATAGSEHPPKAFGPSERPLIVDNLATPPAIRRFLLRYKAD